MRHVARRVCEMLLAAEVPRTEGGGIALCHSCQRTVFFKGGFLSLIAERLDREAKLALGRQSRALPHWTMKRQWLGS